MKAHTGKWVGVMLHHTAGNTSETRDSIRKTHITKNKWGDIGYHYVIEIHSGKTYVKTGRDLKYQGAHAGVDKYNNSYIGVCVVGNYETNRMPESIYNQLIGNICDIMKKKSVFGFAGHREVKATACPGKNMALNQIRADISKKLGKTIKFI